LRPSCQLSNARVPVVKHGRSNPMTPAPSPQGAIVPPFTFRPSVEPSPRWVRVKFGGTVIADSKRVLLLRQYGPGWLPTYYFPHDDVRTDALIPSAPAPTDGDVAYRTVRVGDQVAENAAWVYLAPPPELAALQGYVSFAWDKMEAWFEEEEQVF